MITEMVILFTGLCAFVPERPLDKCDSSFDPPRCAADNRIRVSLLNGDMLYPRHVATVVVKKDFIRATDREYFLAFREDNREFWRFDVKNGERVTLGPSSSICQERGCVEVVNGLVGDADSKECPTPENFRDVYWTGLLSHIAEHQDGRMRDDCRWSHESVTRMVKGQVLLDSGRLEVTAFGRTKTNLIRKWTITRDSTPFIRAFADALKLTKEVNAAEGDPYVQFWQRVGEAWAAAGRITLIPAPKLLVEVKNVPEPNLCIPAPSEEDVENEHYSHLYYLLKRPVDYSEMKSAAAASCKSSVADDPLDICGPADVRLNDVQCPGAWFSEAF